jgi:hypothetical protein
MGLILLLQKECELFRHSTRQLTSSAKAKEVLDHLDQGAFLLPIWLQISSLYT